MPHLTIECSANLAKMSDLGALCRRLAAALMQTGLYEQGAIRVRVVPCETYLVADGLERNAFAAMTLRIGAGRSDADQHRTGETLMQAATAHFAAQLATPYLALSLDIVENPPARSWKQNSIHSRLRGPAT